MDYPTLDQRTDKTISVWDDEMLTHNAQLDAVHHEMSDLLNVLAQTPEAELLTVLDECIAHTRAHFDLEEGWMARLSFPAAGCHISEHNQVFGVMKQVRDAVAQGGFGNANDLLGMLGGLLQK